MTRHAELLDSAVAGRALPRSSHDAERVIADPIVRNRGTDRRLAVPGRPVRGPVGGLRRAQARRGHPRAAAASARSPLREFHLGPYETAVGAGRDPHRDPGPDPARRGQRVREGRAARRRLGRRRRRRVRRGSTATRSPTSASASPRSARRTSCAPRARRRSSRPARRRGEPRRRGAARAGDAASRTTDQRGPADYKRHLAGELPRGRCARAVARCRGQGA